MYFIKTEHLKLIGPPFNNNNLVTPRKTVLC